MFCTRVRTIHFKKCGFFKVPLSIVTTESVGQQEVVSFPTPTNTSSPTPPPRQPLHHPPPPKNNTVLPRLSGHIGQAHMGHSTELGNKV